MLLFPLFFPSSAAHAHAHAHADSGGVKRERAPKLLDLVRYKLALSAWAPPLYDRTTELVGGAARWRVMSESQGAALSLVARGNRCGSRAGPSITARAALQPLLSFTHTYMCGWTALDGGSGASNGVPHQQSAVPHQPARKLSSELIRDTVSQWKSKQDPA